MKVKVTVSVERSKYPSLTLEELRYFIGDSLRFEEASSVEDSEVKISFSVGIFRPIWRWKLLSSIYGGEVIFRSDSQEYSMESRLKFTDTVVIATVLIGGLAVANYQAILAGNGHILNYVIAWTWLIGGNILISIYWWRKFIRQCVSEAADRVIIPRAHLVAIPRSDHDRA
jgi:hypothetical protein